MNKYLLDFSFSFLCREKALRCVNLAGRSDGKMLGCPGEV